MHTRPTQTEFDALLAHKRAEVRDLARHLVAGTLGPQEWADRMRPVLVTGHARAGYLGRQRGGDMAPFDSDDTEFGRMVADDEQPFLNDFRAALEADRYEDDEGHLMLLPILRRAEMYVQRMLGTANEAFVGTSGNDLIWWMLHAQESCPDCLELAAGSPYTSATLQTYPRSGQQACITHCRCTLSRSDGVTGFRAPSLK